MRMKSKGGWVSGLDTTDIKRLVYLKCPKITKEITDCINYIRSGGLINIAEDCNRILGVGLTKESGGHRVIGVSEVITNIADSFVAEAISARMKELATKFQYGLKENGLQELVNFIQIKLELTDVDEAMVLIHIDVQKAFDSMLKCKILDLIEKYAPEYLAYFVDRLGQEIKAYFTTNERKEYEKVVELGVIQGPSSALCMMQF